MGERYFLNTDKQLCNFIDLVKERRKEDSVIVQFVTERTEQQNKLFHAILRSVSKQKKDETPHELKRMVKLHFGVPLLRNHSEEFKHRYDETVKTLSYEQKLVAMDLLPVTSELTPEDFTNLINETVRFFTQEGYDLAEFHNL